MTVKQHHFATPNELDELDPNGPRQVSMVAANITK